ncbi:acyltransferase family protein [Helicobacter sp. MIT 99-5507]|uniref:acyltransferase family protein n=1 Tax=Helicobacter sp. MIT 99-5507 TaxID=152489 RepID=UPI000E1E5857|nr:acyltransferase family protein [Helicobacter sp. MIT 99-5507]RDU58576.1 hypothetical protein CQA42_01970 [Helicobacter sp. MIT 99-5507]
MNRVDFVDNLKGFGVLCVILGHIANPFSNFIYLWHMPLFFFIGGFFINTNKNNIDFIISNTKNLMGIYIIFGILGISIESLKDIALHREIEIKELLIGLFFYMDYEHLQNSYALILWFLPSLLIAKITCFFILKYTKWLFLPYIMAIIFILKYNINLPFVLDIGIITSIFCLFGYFFFKNITRFGNGGGLQIIIWIGLSIFCYLFVEINILKYRNFSWIFSLAFCISFCILLMFVFYKYPKILNFKYFGIHSVFFYVIHIYTNNIANYALKYFGITNWIMIFILSLIILITILYIKLKIHIKK